MHYDYKALFSDLISICTFKKSPKVLPDSNALTLCLMLLYGLSGFFLLSVAAAADVAIMEAFLEALLLAVFVYGLLAFFGMLHRFNQMVSALFGAGVVFTMASLPLVYLVEAAQSTEKPVGAESVVLLVVFGWSIAVMVYIVSTGTNKSISVSSLLTFCYLYLSYYVIHLIYPVVS